MIHRSWRRLSLLCLLAAVAGSCRDSTSGGSRIPATLNIVTGDLQEGTVGTELPTPLTVRVLDADGRPVAGQLVVFRVVEGGGSVFAGAANTDRSGIARERWTLGTSTSGNQRVEARAVESETGNPLLFGVFRAYAKPGPAVVLERRTVATVAQVVGSTAAPPPAVRALDQYGNPVPGVAVTFAASSGGTVTGGSVTTGADGIATVGGWTLSTVSGANTLTATAAGLPALTFTANGTVGAATQLTKQSIDPQVATVATSVPMAPSVTVTDAYGNPVPGVTVTFAITGGGGAVNGASQVTNDLGIATLGSWTLGTAATANTLEARAAGNAVVFTATGTAGLPSKLTRLAGDNQTAGVAQAVPIAPRVRVTDQYDNVVAGAEVTFGVG
jgi:protocatechuate 3,4-dioxygenase beta subunit